MDTAQKLEQTLSENLDGTLERLLAPIAYLERLKRKEYLTPEEVEIVFGLKATTLANKRSKAQGPEYIKDGDKIFYQQKTVRSYLDDRTIRTRSSPPLEVKKPHNRFKK